MRVRMALLFLGALAGAGCGEDASRTMLVEFDHEPNAADEQALTAVGGTVTYRIPLADAVTIYGDLEPGQFAGVPGVIEAYELGDGRDPAVTAFIEFDRPPTEADVAFVRSLGARSATAHQDVQLVVASRLPVSSAPRLGENEHVIAVELDGGGDLSPQP